MKGQRSLENHSYTQSQHWTATSLLNRGGSTERELEARDARHALRKKNKNHKYNHTHGALKRDRASEDRAKV